MSLTCPGKHNSYVILENDKENLADLRSENPTMSKLNYWREKSKSSLCNINGHVK